MTTNKLYFGDTLLSQTSKSISLESVTLMNETFFKIENYDDMTPFFMTIVSDVDFWLFISSTGGLTAGRKNPENALFPYYTDDKIHDSSETTGSHTMMIVTSKDKQSIWIPFSRHYVDVYNVTRNIYKNAIGNKIVFEEVNHDLQVVFRYSWKTSNRYGFVKESELLNTGSNNLSIKVLDGIRNILPYGVNTLLQSTKSTLADGYKRCELKEDIGLGLFTLSSIISDKAEPSESLKATTVWSKGLEHPVYLLSEQQIQSFCRNETIETEYDIKGRRGAFYVSDTLTLMSNESKKWFIVSELGQSSSKVEALAKDLKENTHILVRLYEDILSGDKNLKKLVFDADGMQLAANEKVGYRHFSNTLYNIMRGGIYSDGYTVVTSDLKQFIKTWNKDVYTKHAVTLDNLPERLDYIELLKISQELGDNNLERIVLEYLPLTYSRRHGDPSRPWNMFNIEILKENGDRNLNFEGNWRDIFQNWEALSFSFPNFIESIISKFVNASSPDGYNPYRITKNGIDWEVLDPKDPWSNIGYWGDHQIIYLLKLMELSQKYNPSNLIRLLQKDIFVYANVPYRIKGFNDLVKDPRNSIDFDDDREKVIEQRVSEIGCDGKLVFVHDTLYHVNFMEKLLVPLLSKFTNYVPEGGIWMNTQRPEWNDANNALVGNGVSMVTLYYMFRYLRFIKDILSDAQDDFYVSHEVYTMFNAMTKVLTDYHKYLGTPLSDEERFTVVSKLGTIGETYRSSIYNNGFSAERKIVTSKEITEFATLAMSHLQDTITKNKREDGLYHAYNLITFKNDACSISYLSEMLEGQVAVLSSKAIDTSEVLRVLKALRESALYREDQDSYMLYPNRDLPLFLSKNNLPKEMAISSNVLRLEIEKGYTRFIETDVHGKYHFNGQFRNGDEMMEAMRSTHEYSDDEILVVGEIFSTLFDHHSFTGRSGTFYKYEGLGCIYWHMVSKLVLSVQECFNDVIAKEGLSKEALEIATYYHKLKAGIGLEKSPTDYGAFPTDAYSHTPGFAGVQQPGMTGQVKEDILSRFGELGLSVRQGELYFEPSLLRKSEFLDKGILWELPVGTIELEKNQLGFTFGAVPIVYALSDDKAIIVHYNNGDTFKFENTSKLNKEISRGLFNRNGDIAKILVNIDEKKLNA